MEKKKLFVSKSAITKVQAVIIAVIIIVAVIAGAVYYFVTFPSPTLTPATPTPKTPTPATPTQTPTPATPTQTPTPATPTQTPTPATPPPLAGQVIKIGVVLPLSGALAPFGQQGLKGLQLGVEEVNEEGGVLGAKLILIYEDSTGDPKVAVSATEKLITIDHVEIITGAYQSAAMLSMQEVTEKYEIPFIGLGGVAAELTTKGAKYFVRIVGNTTDTNSATIGFLRDVVKPKTVGVLHEPTLMGVSSKDMYIKLAEKEGYSIVSVESYSPGTMDFKPLLAKIRIANPDVLLIVAYLTDLATIAKQMREMEYKPKAVFIEAGSQNLDFLNIVGSAAHGWFVQTQYWPERKYPSYSECYKAGKKFWDRWGKALDNISGNGYVIPFLLKIAVEKCKSLKPTEMMETIKKTQFTIPWWGPIAFDSKGNNVHAGEILFISQILPAEPETPWQANGLSFFTVWPDHAKVREPVYPIP